MAGGRGVSWCDLGTERRRNDTCMEVVVRAVLSATLSSPLATCFGLWAEVVSGIE